MNFFIFIYLSLSKSRVSINLSMSLGILNPNSNLFFQSFSATANSLAKKNCKYSANKCQIYKIGSHIVTYCHLEPKFLSSCGAQWEAAFIIPKISSLTRTDLLHN